jgi:hypothetical protein
VKIIGDIIDDEEFQKLKAWFQKKFGCVKKELPQSKNKKGKVKGGFMPKEPMYPHVSKGPLTGEIKEGELVRCDNCRRVVVAKWKFCAYCAFRLKNEDGTRRKRGGD